MRAMGEGAAARLLTTTMLVLLATAVACAGPEGPEGPAGPAGAKGADGADGADGTDGADGDPGPAGEPGEDGVNGCDARDPDGPSEIWIREPGVLPLGIAAGPDGSLYVADGFTGQVLRVAPGDDEAVPFIAGPLTGAIGLASDGENLWVCDVDLLGEAGVGISAFDLDDGSLKVTHQLPDDGVCSDVLVTADGDVLLTDGMNNRVLRIAAADAMTAGTAEVFVENDGDVFGPADPSVLNLNGLARDSAGSLYTVATLTRELFRVDFVDGEPQAPVAITLTDALENPVSLVQPFGLELLDDGRLLVTDVGIGLALITLDDTDGGVFAPLNTRLEGATSTAVFMGQAYIVESQLTQAFGNHEVPHRIVRHPLGSLLGHPERELVHDIDYLFIRNVRCPTENGQSLLWRDEDGLELEIFVDNADNGIWTGWWIVVNHPECLDPAAGCSPEMAVIYASGFEVTDNRIHERVSIATGDYTGIGAMPDVPFFGINSQEVTNPEGAWVRYVYKYKGPPSDDETVLENQLTTIGTGCDVLFPDISALVPIPIGYCPDKFQASFGAP